jgi:hypothetical protein
MIAALLPGLMAILGKLIPDPQALAAAQLKLLAMQQTGQLAELSAAVSVIIAEASGNWLQRSWRPLMMITFTALIVARWLGWTAPNLQPAEYEQLWEIIKLGIGGYTIGRTVEKVTPAIVDAIKGKA